MFSIRSLRLKTLLSALLPMALVLAVMALIVLYEYERVAQDVVEQRDTELAVVSAARLSEGLGQYSRLLQEIAAGDDARSMEPARLALPLEEARDLLYVFDAGLAIYDSEGLALAPRQGMDFPIPSKLDEIRRTLRPIFSDVFQDEISGEDVMLTGAPILGSDGELKGVLAGMSTVKYSLLGGMYAEVLEFKAGRSGYAYLVDGNGQVIYHRYSSQVGGSLADTDPVIRVTRGETGAVLTEDTTGKTVISGFAPVPGTGWGLVTQERWDVVMGPIRRYGTWLLGILIGGSVISGALVFFSISQVLRPIQDLTRGAERIAGGDFDHTVVVKTGDEIEALARQFNAMSVALKESFAELEKRLVERQRAEESLRESEEKLRVLFDGTYDLITLTDANATTLWANPAWKDVFGEDLAGQEDPFKLIPPDDLDEVAQAWTALVTRKEAIKSLVYRFEVEDGGYRFFESSAYPVTIGGEPLFYVVARDITDRKRAEETVRESEAKYRTLVENLPQKIFHKNNDSVYVTVNENLARDLNITPDEMAGKTDYDFWPRELADKYRADDKRIRESGETEHIEEVYIQDGEERVVQTIKVPVRDEESNVVGILGIFWDITERKRAEEELRQHREHLEELVGTRTTELDERVAEAEQLNRGMTNLLEELQAAKGDLESTGAKLQEVNQELNDFAYVVSHDLKAPLRAVTQLAGWIATDYADALGEGGQEMVSLLIGRTKRMHNLIQGILEYSRIGRVKEREKEVDLNQLVPETIEMLSPPENIQITIKSELPTVMGEQVRLEQLFQNLLDNAIRFMDKPAGRVIIDCADEGVHWLFSVADNGPGIEEKYHDKVFQMFQTLAPRDELESTGVGLALVKKIVETWGGSVWVESTVGEGSTFFFTLPQEVG